MTDTHIDTVLSAIRRLIRATDLHSRELVRTTGLTAPQLLLLQTIAASGEITISGIAARMSLSQATVTNIVERLENRMLVTRVRSQADRRKVHVEITPKARETIHEAPVPMQESFVRAFSDLPDWEQSMIIASLQKLAAMMDAENLDAAPVLEVGALSRESPAAEPGTT